METTEKTIEVLNDLIQINNDRVAGFERASENLDDEDQGMQPIFEKLADDSRDYADELSMLTLQLGGEAEEGTSTSGALHRAWLSVKATFTGNDLESVLNECERGEDAIKKAYSDALEDSNELSPEAIAVISEQQQGIIAAHDLIKSLRNQARDTDDNNEDQTGSANETETWSNNTKEQQPYNATGIRGNDEIVR